MLLIPDSMALLAPITMLSQLQEACTCYHLAPVTHIAHAFPCQVSTHLHTCSALALHHVNLVHVFTLACLHTTTISRQDR